MLFCINLYRLGYYYKMNKYELYKALEKPEISRYRYIVQWLIFGNLLLNIGATIAPELFQLTPKVIQFCYFVEVITVMIFAIELIARYTVIGFDPRYTGIKGKLKFTFTPLTLIDWLTILSFFLTFITSNVAFSRSLRFIKYIRLLKLFRIQSLFRRFFSIRFFATSPIWLQFIILLLTSATCITIFSFIFDNHLSMMIFLAPEGLAEITDKTELFLGVVELIFGLIIGGTLISIITELLTNVSNDIKNGEYPYKGKNHIIIVNYSPIVDILLSQINFYYQSIEQRKDVVIFLPKEENGLENFPKLTDYSYLDCFIVRGNAFQWESYEHLNINTAQYLLFVKNQDNKSYLNEKMLRFLTSHVNFFNKQLKMIIEISKHYDELIYNQILVNVTNPYFLVNQSEITENFLKRTIVDPLYFSIYSYLLSFQYVNFVLESIPQSCTYFKDVNSYYSDNVVLGLMREEKLILNPNDNFCVIDTDKAILLKIRNKALSLSERDGDIICSKSPVIEQPRLKIKRKIVIVGNYQFLNCTKICDFLDEESIKQLNTIIPSNNDYLNINFWNNLLENFEYVILNIDDDDVQFMIMMLLESEFKGNNRLLNRFINIIHQRVNEQFFINSTHNYNLIVTQKIFGCFVAQMLFDHRVKTIFSELTESYGNEIYILPRKNDIYNCLFSLEKQGLKKVLREHNMTYLGVVDSDNNFILDDEFILTEMQAIVVITRGV